MSAEFELWFKATAAYAAFFALGLFLSFPGMFLGNALVGQLLGATLLGLTAGRFFGKVTDDQYVQAMTYIFLGMACLMTYDLVTGAGFGALLSVAGLQVIVQWGMTAWAFMTMGDLARGKAA
jgi:hypothetical protein